MFINFCHVVGLDKILFRALNKNPNIYYDIRGTPSVKLKKFAKKNRFGFSYFDCLYL